MASIFGSENLRDVQQCSSEPTLQFEETTGFWALVASGVRSCVEVHL